MLNNVTLMGRICNEIEVRTTANGKSVATFRIAVDRSYSKNGKKGTDFITLVCWEGTSSFVEKWFKKGDMIAIQGRIQTRNYEDNNGNKRTAFEVVATEVSFCGGKNEGASAPSMPATSTIPGFSEMPVDNFEEIPDTEDLPF